MNRVMAYGLVVTGSVHTGGGGSGADAGDDEGDVDRTGLHGLRKEGREETV